MRHDFGFLRYFANYCEEFTAIPQWSNNIQPNKEHILGPKKLCKSLCSIHTSLAFLPASTFLQEYKFRAGSRRFTWDTCLIVIPASQQRDAEHHLTPSFRLKKKLLDSAKQFKWSRVSVGILEGVLQGKAVKTTMAGQRGCGAFCRTLLLFF